MGFARGPKIVTDGLIITLDAANPKSYTGSGTDWKDLSGQGNNGTLINGPTFDTINNGNILFDGVNDYVQIDYSGSLITNSYTFSFLAKHNGERDSRRTMLGLSNGGDYAFKVFTMQIWDSNTHYLSFIGNNTTYSTRSFQLNTNFQEWNHFTAINTPTQVQIYVNGQLKTSVTNPLRGTFDRIWIGTRLGQYWKGWIPDLKVYNRALTPQEILQNYNATKSRFNL